jgi:DNA-binding transcriptional regulator YdaS (Cro superfamily)
MTALSQSIGLSRSAIYQWNKRIPAERVMDIEAATGIDRAKLRPDLYGADRRAKRRR